MTKKMIVYTCPFCKDVQTSIIQWQTVSVAFEYKLRTGASEEVDRQGGEAGEAGYPLEIIKRKT